MKSSAKVLLNLAGLVNMQIYKSPLVYYNSMLWTYRFTVIIYFVNENFHAGFGEFYVLSH